MNTKTFIFEPQYMKNTDMRIQLSSNQVFNWYNLNGDIVIYTDTYLSIYLYTYIYIFYFYVHWVLISEH